MTVGANDAELPARESMEFDVVIVGAGPAGLSAAIRLKQLSPDLSVVVLEKGAEVGAHILSGCVLDPSSLDRLLPDWRQEETPIRQKVTDDRFYLYGPQGALRLPGFGMPRLMHNHGNFVVSLGLVCKWLAGKAEELGVEIYPGFAASELIVDEAGAVIGVATGDMGIERDGSHGPNYQRGMALMGRYVLIGEGVRGSLAKELIERFSLERDSEPQKFGLGIKELWEIKPEKHKPGLIQHSFGWPLKSDTGGGSFIYHLPDNKVYVGFVTHLNYKNPYLSPFGEFQRFKTHPDVAELLEGGKRLSYGARAISEGGFQSVPKLVFPGGALLGCSAGFVNVPRIKGVHNAIASGMLAAEAAAEALAAGRSRDELSAYEDGWRQSSIGRDLSPVRNVKPLWSRFGTYVGVALGALDMWTNSLFRLSLFGTLGHGKTDAQSTEPASRHKPIDYPKPDGVLTFDKTSSVFLSNTNHEEDQPVHLRVRDMALQKTSEHDVYAGLSERYCPAAVYEWVGEGQDLRYQINAQNCVHCKTCDIKDPNGNIRWTVPQGGEGPVYQEM
ncbi:electron-transferring-flavoprotein dehydrogenase [Aureimonas altamirensis DSM 21988]|uniref:Electron transfer flavoprotein-ubiquinone oxidoreductase n=1 Tax=Aureimonas altamirensis DSM 21988 TaxID=1121026 RepID=A0ABY1I304_9HYPH|nr:electron transfer flavoprotein-ubiquinone oxidoreductase [Aureimonas altamirensis]SHI52751.1 electron-transferring-flavoprotein dehydrogenase [Aureimonas altamirensis DSM 21988]